MSKQTHDHRQEPLYWFGILELARERSDFERAAEADRELLRLGIKVRFIRRKIERQEN